MSDHQDRPSQLGPPEVEAFSDLSWARVERGLWARLDGAAPVMIADRPSRRWWWIAAPALAAAAVAAVVVSTGDQHAPAVADNPTRVVSSTAPSSISFGDAHITLDADSAVVMSSDGTSNAMLERGGAWFAIAKRSGHPFVVVAGDTIVRVVGTRFRVARSEELATVEVQHGLVEITFQGTTVRVGPGQSWSSELPAHVTATPAASVEPRPTTELSAIEDDRVKYERLTAAEVSDPAAALAGYLELSRRSGPWAEVALFAAGRLAADRHDDRAETLLSIYLRRFPRGANAADARQLLDRLKGAH
ncbi:MAG: FecR domain-containing protein [Deltaproteobacteria bacterium]|nr:FecR domain-containing protein [Deltaproteobacteria bacterium]MDQ3297758.1 FecR family protein [Myxococcota bacterium]